MVVGLLSASTVALLVSADTMLDSAMLLQATRNKQSRSHTVKEDCTGKDVWLWLGNHKQVSNPSNEHLWVKQTSADFSSDAQVFYAKTRGKTCKQWCKDEKQAQCVRGMDDAHHQTSYISQSQGTKCTLWPSGHNRRPTDEAGCKQKWLTQMCACATESTLPMGNECTADPDEDPLVVYRACEVVSANPNDPYDSTKKADFILRSDAPASSAHTVEVNEAGNFVIVSDGTLLLTPEFEIEGGVGTGRELVLPDDFELSIVPTLQDGSVLLLQAEHLKKPIPDSYELEEIDGVQWLSMKVQPPGPIVFTKLPKFKVIGPVEIEIKATGNIVSNCLTAYHLEYTNNKCKYQNQDRLWRLRNTTLEKCYDICAAHPDCHFFSHDDSSYRWKDVCMGCKAGSEPGKHTDFNFYSICKRAEVQGQCERHDEHVCRDKLDGGTVTGISALECRDACADPTSPHHVEGCELFSYTPETSTPPETSKCELCPHQYVFKGKGTGSSSVVMGKDCTDAEINAKFLVD